MVVTRSAGAVALAEPVRLDRGWCLGSDGEGKFSEGCRKLMSRVDVGGEFEWPRRRFCTNACPKGSR
jgi:hypothetical protein